MSAALLEIENLTKSFGGVHAVRNCTFSVPEGQVTGLIGPNGAGKSTVVDLVSGFGRPDSGSVRFAGEPIIGKRPDVISRLGLIRTFQTPREWRNLTVMDNVLLARRRFADESLWRSMTRARRIRRAEEADRAAVRDILERFQLAGLRNELAVQTQRRPETAARIRPHRRRRGPADHPGRADGRRQPGARRADRRGRPAVRGARAAPSSWSSTTSRSSREPAIRWS